MTGSEDDHSVRWLSVKEVAARLGISTRAVYDRIDDGRLRAHNFGGEAQRALWRIKETEVERFIQASEYHPAKDAS